ncbi:fumarylacetoacetate hydrolase family protein [Pseudohalioglobus lutimaris]|uniref:FAA hydrolase family protein n=1 Tax=Pseudohalioglobus lutimaris TaxID=1737061 RepID=A0A2N5X8D6_9GAMM|nr:fumarylacetoacetate hydrolase family protein [Pseudohalioglobus lutimaris]PLW70764.1 FAA hydrolase family protein [Pseudohalioglobus lutimaris]
MKTVLLDGAAITPSKILCIGRNYVEHIRELGNEIPEEMVVFGKPNSAIGATLNAQLDGEPLHYEGEIALLIERGRPVAAGFGLDLTKRELQGRLKSAGLPWERAKAFDGAALFSPFCRFDGDTAGLSLLLEKNGKPCQQGSVSLMMYPPETIISELTRFTTLEDGDIVMTGTPAGVGAVQPGETFAGKIFNGSQLLTEAKWIAQ